MPLSQYRILKRAVEIEQFGERARSVHDQAHAFSGAKELLNEFKLEINRLENNINDGSKISWGNKDPNYVSKLNKWRR